MKKLVELQRHEIHEVYHNDSQSKPFEYRTKKREPSQRRRQSGNLGDTDQLRQRPEPLLNVEVTVPFKYQSNFGCLLIYI